MHPIAIRPAALCVLVACLLPLGAQAGRAQAGIGITTWSNTNLDDAVASGQSWRDGQALETVSDAANPPDKDHATVSLFVGSGARNSSAQAEVQAQARLRSNGEAFSGHGRVGSDLDAGTLALQWHSNRAQEPGTPREGFARGYPFAELWETFEVVYPITRAEPVQVSLSLLLQGGLTGVDPADPLRPGIEAYLWLGGVDTGEFHDPLSPVWRSESSEPGAVLGYEGALQSSGCSVALGVCSGFFNLYAALDLRGRVTGALPDDWQTARAPLDLLFTGQLALQVSNGVTLVRGDVLDPLPDVNWAQVSSVPEPASAASLLAGLLAVAAAAAAHGRKHGCAARVNNAAG